VTQHLAEVIASAQGAFWRLCLSNKMFFGVQTMTSLNNYHIDYRDVTRHWHADSEKYAGGDHLLTAIYDGWEIQAVYQEVCWHLGMRSTFVYHFVFEHRGAQMVMPVVDNPYVNRFIQAIPFEIQPIEALTTKRVKVKAR
jgi:hypothetical protein